MKITKDYLKKLIKEELQEATRITKTLRVKKGDPVLIGLEGSRDKFYTIVKHVDEDKIVDSEGNVYEPSGRLRRRSSTAGRKFGHVSDPGGKNIQMQIYDIDDHTNDFRETLRSFMKYFLREKFNSLSLDQMKDLAKMLKVSIGEKKYKEDI